jgi:predicted dehydrogenase
MIAGMDGAMLLTRSKLSIDGEDIALDDSTGPFVRQMEEFISSIREGRAPTVPGSDGVRTMRVLDLARLASDHHTVEAF